MAGEWREMAVEEFAQVVGGGTPYRTQPPHEPHPRSHPAIYAQLAYYRSLGLRDRILNVPLMVAAILAILWRQIPSACNGNSIAGNDVKAPSTAQSTGNIHKQGALPMKTRINLIFVLVSMVLLVSACAPATGQPIPTRTLSVNGSSQLMLDPDIAYISIGVQTKGKDAAEATNANNAQAARVVQAMKDMGIADKDLRTINFNIYPQQQYGPNGEMLEIEYVVDNTVYVTLREMDKVSAILDAAVKAGANSVYGIQFDVEDKDAALTQAREMAVQSARKQAEQMAAAVGVKLGAVQNVNFYDNGGPTPIYFDNKAAGMGGAERAYAVPINPGQISVTVQVNIVYEIK